MFRFNALSFVIFHNFCYKKKSGCRSGVGRPKEGIGRGHILQDKLCCASRCFDNVWVFICKQLQWRSTEWRVSDGSGVLLHTSAGLAGAVDAEGAERKAVLMFYVLMGFCITQVSVFLKTQWIVGWRYVHFMVSFYVKKKWTINEYN